MRALVRPGASGAAGVKAMRQRLARLGVTDVGVITPSTPAIELAAVAGALRGRTLLVDADLLVADACLGQLVDDPAVRSGALVLEGAIGAWATDAGARLAADNRPAPGAAVESVTAAGLVNLASETPEAAPEPAGFEAPPGGTTPPPGGTSTSWLGRATPVRSAHRRIASAGSNVHRVSAPGQAFLGALVIAAEDRDQSAKVLAAAADTSRYAGWDGDPIDLALVALVRGQVTISTVGSVGPVLRGGTQEQRAPVLGELEAIDESRVLLERANRPDDGFYSTFVLRRASKPVTALALRLRLSPNQISMFSLAVGFAAAACFAWGTWPALLAGALLLQASLIIDCVDGEVARFTRSFSALGAWLDAASDRVKEYAAYAGLAIGAARSGEDLWLLATLVMVMQTVRHVGDYDFSRVQRVRESWVPARALLDPADGGVGGAGATLDLSEQLNRNTRVRWAKKALHMPIGERWLVLSVGAVTVGPRGTLLLLLGLGVLAFAYTTAGRILRSARWKHPADRSGSWLLEPQLDLGPLGEPLWHRTLGRLKPLARSFGWAWPVAMRAIELGLLWWVVRSVAPAAAPWLFVWTFAVAFHHYDLLYRVLGGSVPPRWLSWFGLGWEGRTILVLLAAWAGASTLTTLLHVGTPPLVLLFVVIASAQWIRSLRPRTPEPRTQEPRAQEPRDA